MTQKTRQKTSEPKPVIQAKSMVTGDDNDVIITLPSGDKARIVPVSAALIDEVTSHIIEPDVPMWQNPDHPTSKEPDGRTEPNPNDPKYIRELDEARRKQGIAAIDAMVMFGVELIDGVPDDRVWLKKLQYLEKRQILDLSSFDVDDEYDLEFLYKRYVAIDSNTLTKISEVSGLSASDVERAERSFRGD